jgi:hypothetical protein
MNARPVFPMIGLGSGTLSESEIFVEIEYAVPAVRPGAREESLRVRMPRERAREFGQALLETADTPHKARPRH